jgi:Txe/YoeB family toxin of Txe-Axe toxin-antitoxin module
MRILKPSKVIFGDNSTEKEFNELDENDEIKRYLKRAIKDIQENAFCGIPIPKKLIPKEYIQKYGINNLWKYDLPDGWRVVYSITTPTKVEIISIILEWFDHTNYERRFHY